MNDLQPLDRIGRTRDRGVVRRQGDVVICRRLHGQHRGGFGIGMLGRIPAALQ